MQHLNSESRKLAGHERYHCSCCRRTLKARYHPCYRLYLKIGEVDYKHDHHPSQFFGRTLFHSDPNPFSLHDLLRPCIGPDRRWWDLIVAELSLWYFGARWHGHRKWLVGIDWSNSVFEPGFQFTIHLLVGVVGCHRMFVPHGKER